MNKIKQYSHQYADLYFNPITSIIEEVWKAETENMTDEEYKEYQATKIEVTQKLMPKFFLCDTQNFLYTMQPEMQKWTDEKLNKFWAEIGLKKFAMLMSKSYVEQLALELTMTERDVKELGYDFQFFDNKEEAEKWLLS